MSPFNRARGAPPPTTGGGGIGGLANQFGSWLTHKVVPEAGLGGLGSHLLGLPWEIGAAVTQAVMAIGRAGTRIAQNAVRLPGLASLYSIGGAMAGAQGDYPVPPGQGLLQPGWANQIFPFGGPTT